jgi:anti-anti-sigma factor
MPERQERIVECPFIVLAIRQERISSDTIAELLRDELLSTYQQSGAIHAVIDFQAVTYLSSAGFRPLLSLNRRVRERGGRLVLCNLRPVVEEVFSVTHLIDATGAGRTAFLAQPSVPAAVAHLCRQDVGD